MEQIPQVTTKKLYNMARVFLFMIQKSVSKSQFLLDLHLMMKHGKILGKALNDLLLQHHTTLTCRPHDMHMSVISPREYEFSCSNSPAHQSHNPFHVSSRLRRTYYLRKRYYTHYKHRRYHSPTPCRWDDVAFDDYHVAEEESPLVGPGFGWSPLVRQVRITDSPFPLRDDDEDCHVDKEAEKFIERFRKELRLQKCMAAGDVGDRYYG